ncbi:hypothetical protein MRB53_022050 [Persea americana]|uniref:Uncharacterized protein n=1 Tax=Persea americana TaxID=3435 RepID=A0ACC2L6L5_PERAE|nr:hypothetical protein MRB53_022050 [Persea americana]
MEAPWVVESDIKEIGVYSHQPAIVERSAAEPAADLRDLHGVDGVVRKAEEASSFWPFFCGFAVGIKRHHQPWQLRPPTNVPVGNQEP